MENIYSFLSAQSSPALHYHIPDLTHPPPRDASHCWMRAACRRCLWQHEHGSDGRCWQQYSQSSWERCSQRTRICPSHAAPGRGASHVPLHLTRGLTKKDHRSSCASGCWWALLRGAEWRSGAHPQRGAAHWAAWMLGATSSAMCQGTALPTAYLAALPGITMLLKAIWVLPRYSGKAFKTRLIWRKLMQLYQDNGAMLSYSC